MRPNRKPRSSALTRGADEPTATQTGEIILLAVTGMSPAILTETVWALAEEDPPVIPDHVMVLTTSTGKEQIIQELFTPQRHFNNQCGWDCLLQKLKGSGHSITRRLRFDPGSHDLHVLTRWTEHSRRNQELDDIRSKEDNDAVADTVLDVVRGIVENSDKSLIASIAGGRKTMGALLYACMTLIARETDRVTHVLVDEPFDDPRLSPKFYFPEQPVGELKTPTKTKVNAKSAKIILADLPFVPLRNLFRKQLKPSLGSFRGLIAGCRQDVARQVVQQISLIIYNDRPEIDINQIRIRLSAREQLLMLFLATHAAGGRSRWTQFVEAEDQLNEFREGIIRSAPADQFSDWRHHQSLKEPISESTADHVRKLLHGLRSKFQRKGGDAAVLAALLPEKGRFTLDLPRSRIRVC